MKLFIILTISISTIFGFAYADSDVSATASTDNGDGILYVDRQVMITADVTNNQDVVQPFAYLIQIKNDNDVVISLSWLSGSLSPNQSLSPAQSWTPSEAGTFAIDVFVWEGVDNPEALSPPLSMTVTVIDETA